MSSYKLLKNIFVDTIDVDEYIELESALYSYNTLFDSISRPLKMILLFGRPGTGKSVLLNRIYQNLKYQREIHYFDAPSIEPREFFRKFFKLVTLKELPKNTEVNFTTLIDYCKSIRGKREITILLDEAQMYDEQMLEKIRVLSDTGAIKFVISIHKTQNEDLIAKEHFQTRIWETIELRNISKEELKTYIHKKLLKRNYFDIADTIKDKHIHLIYSFTKGNFRECNKVMFKIFEIYEYYEAQPHYKIEPKKFSTKFIEMAAIRLGYIHV
ncbi:MAG: ATPase AAA [Sulfurovum sp. FS08-3]|nr:MAG: ATPase AAA [Sulfurovum sp. FS08-3]